MDDSRTTVAVGLDVHAASIRLAAVRADELLEERTLPYDEGAVERLLRRWPVVRCCYEAGPTGFGLHRHLVERGIDCLVVAPGLVPQRPGERVKTDSRDARKLARLLAGGLLQPIHVPSPELEAARDLVRAREDARLDRMKRAPPALADGHLLDFRTVTPQEAGGIGATNGSILSSDEPGFGKRKRGGRPQPLRSFPGPAPPILHTLSRRVAAVAGRW